MQTNIQNERTESIQIFVNPRIKEQFQMLSEQENMTLEEALNNYMEERCLENEITDEQWDEAYFTPENQEMIAEMEALMKDPNAKRYRCVKELRADCLAGDDD